MIILAIEQVVRGETGCNTCSPSYKYVFFWVVVGNLHMNCGWIGVKNNLVGTLYHPSFYHWLERRKFLLPLLLPLFFWSCYLNLPQNVLASVELWSSAEPIIPQRDESCKTGVLTLLCSILFNFIFNFLALPLQRITLVLLVIVFTGSSSMKLDQSLLYHPWASWQQRETSFVLLLFGKAVVCSGRVLQLIVASGNCLGFWLVMNILNSNIIKLPSLIQICEMRFGLMVKIKNSQTFI